MQNIVDLGGLQAALVRLTGIESHVDPRLHGRIQGLLEELGSPQREMSQVKTLFYARINEKLSLNKQARTMLYGDLSRLGYTFNFPAKKSLNRLLDLNDLQGVQNALVELGVPNEITSRVCEVLPVASTSDTRAAIIGETNKPSKLRRAKKRDVADEVFHSCLGALIWSIWSEEMLYRHFGGGGNGSTAAQYIEFLQGLHPELFNRDRTLAVRFLSPDTEQGRVFRREETSSWMQDAYYGLGNHGFVALVIDANHPSAAWECVNDATLFGEKFLETPLKQMFFRSKEVEKETVEHMGDHIDTKKARFDLLNEGFTYRDVFVLTDEIGVIRRLVLVMQKNERDETRIPCPACRGLEIEGNSYPSFGVRSWECRNPLCPGRSIYNRGYRYQFRSVVQQAAIEDPRSLIDVKSISRWRRDVLPFESDAEIVATLVKHYSLFGDGVSLEGFNGEAVVAEQLGRRLASKPPSTGEVSPFWDGAYFARFEEPPATLAAEQKDVSKKEEEPGPYHEVALGDSRQVLAQLGDAWVSRAITSPPYFNAREYSQWPNFYTYLFDMRQNAREVYRALRPGGLYVFNVFDYFDNERTVNFSLMGKKRIALGAHIAAEFERIGYELLTVVPWDKGEIQGKRGFNGGNRSPYYQAPFNCWEHIFIFRKPGNFAEEQKLGLPAEKLQRVLTAKPVFKMVAGVNSYGHTAPFPVALPDHFLDGLENKDTVLDPYAGSATTGVACLRRGLGYFMIEMDPEYAALAARKLSEAEPSLFSVV